MTDKNHTRSNQKIKAKYEVIEVNNADWGNDFVRVRRGGLNVRS